jgi:hypothetical protein
MIKLGSTLACAAALARWKRREPKIIKEIIFLE